MSLIHALKEPASSMPMMVLSAVMSLTLTGSGNSRLLTNRQNAPQTPSEVARVLSDRGGVVQVPAKGKVKQSIAKEAPTFAMPEGSSSVVLLRLPDYQKPYEMTILSFRRGVGRTTEIFIPSGLYFDEAFVEVGNFGEDRLSGAVESVGVQVAIDETTKDVRYILLYTRGDLVGQRIGVRASINGVPVPGKVGTFLGSGFGLGRVERSLEAKLEVQTRPATTPASQSAGVPAVPEQTPLGTVLKPGDGVSVPVLIKEVKPQYPRELVTTGIEGVVILEAVVLPAGAVGDIRVTRSLEWRLDEEATKALKQWRFKPGSKEGRVVPILVTIQMEFSLRKRTDLFEAVKSGDVEETRRLFAEGADSNARDDQGAVPLLRAAASGFTEIAELLIAHGAEVDAKDRSGFTSLHAAAYNSQRGVAELLIAKGAQVNAKSTADWTPLHKAMERLANPEVTPNQVSQSDVAAMVSVVELLLANGADVTAKAASGDAPLHFAAGSGQKELVEHLLARGADVNVKGYEEVTPLYAAVKRDRAEIAEALIAHGATVDARTKSAYTPLLQAAQRGNSEIVELLVVHGADINAKDHTGRTALIWAVLTANFASPSGQGLLSRRLTDAEQTQFRKDLQSVKGQWREVARLLIERGADVNATASGEHYPLYMAATMGDKDLVEALIAKGAKLNPAVGSESPLHGAIGEKHKDVAELLINKGANVNARNVSGRTPLHFLATFMNDRNLAVLMIAHGADINARDKNGATPLRFATNAGNEQVVEVLRQHGGK